MKLKLVVLSVVLALAGFTSNASAAQIWLNIDHCTDGCGPMPAGMVTLTQSGTGSVDVRVDLFDNREFLKTGFDGTFGFNLSTNPPITISGLTAGWLSSNLTTGEANLQFDGFGYFQYAVTWGQHGGGAGTEGPLTFTVTAPGLTVDSFLTPSVRGAPPVFFVADVAWYTSAGVRNTGVVGGSSAVEPVPEPASMLLLGTGLLAAGLFGRRRR